LGRGGKKKKKGKGGSYFPGDRLSLGGGGNLLVAEKRKIGTDQKGEALSLSPAPKGEGFYHAERGRRKIIAR